MKLPFRAVVFMDHSLCWCCSWALHLWEASLGWLNFPFYFLDDVHLIFTIVHWQHERALSTWLDTVEDKENPNMVPCGCNHQFSLFLSLYVVLGITSSLHTNLGKKEVRNLGFDSYLVKALIWRIKSFSCSHISPSSTGTCQHHTQSSRASFTCQPQHLLQPQSPCYLHQYSILFHLFSYIPIQDHPRTFQLVSI